MRLDQPLIDLALIRIDLPIGEQRESYRGSRAVKGTWLPLNQWCNKTLHFVCDIPHHSLLKEYARHFILLGIFSTNYVRKCVQNA